MYTSFVFVSDLKRKVFQYLCFLRFQTVYSVLLIKQDVLSSENLKFFTTWSKRSQFVFTLPKMFVSVFFLY